MKKIVFLLVCIASITRAYVQNPQLPAKLRARNLYLVDTVEAVVLTQEDVEVITKSDVDRPNLAGGVRSRDDLVFERLVYLDAKKHKINPDEQAVDRYLNTVMRENNMTMAELEKVFAAGGYSLADGRKEFERLQAVNTMFEFKIRSNLIVPRKEVEAYYHQNPEIEPASYFIEYAFVPLAADTTRTRQKERLEHMVTTGVGLSKLQWNAPFWVQQGDIAPEKQFIFDLKMGMVSMPFETPNGFELYRLKDKKSERVRTLEERYRDISDVLRQPRFEELMGKYRKELFGTASVIYL